MVQVRLYAMFRELAGLSSVELEAPTVRDLLEALARRCGEPFRAAVFQSTALRRHVAVMVDGVSIGRAKGLETPLEPSSVVSILPPVTGGGSRRRLAIAPNSATGLVDRSGAGLA